jgi:hypothetical protein
MKHLLIRESDNTQTVSSQVCIPRLIMLPPLISIMNCPITLNYQLRFKAIEIRNVIAKLMLPSKFESHQLSVSK